MTHSESPSHFYCALAENRAKVQALEEELAQYCHSETAEDDQVLGIADGATVAVR